MTSQASVSFRNARIAGVDLGSAVAAAGDGHARAGTSRLAAYSVTSAGPADFRSLRAQWSRLTACALQPNAFHELGYLEAAGRELPLGRRLDLALVWHDAAGEEPSLVGAFPLLSGPGWTSFWPVVTDWAPVYSSLGVPLVDGAHSANAVEAFLDWLRGRRNRGAILLRQVDIDGPFASVLRAVATETGRSVTALAQHDRAGMFRGSEDDPATALGSKKSKELRRLARRLGDIGEISFVCASGEDEVAEATEAFLLLERSGWKGKAGTALLDRPDTAAFTRAMTRALAAEGKCRVHTMLVGGKAVASGILIDSRDRSWFWKTGYDEAFSRFSPGVLLTLQISRAQAARAQITLTDSCAVAHHPMIDHVWRDRITIADLLVSTGPGDGIAAAIALGAENGRRKSRDLAKSLFHRLKGLSR